MAGLSPRNRAWDIHYATQMYAATGEALQGINMYMSTRFEGAGEIVTSNPLDNWIVLPAYETWHGQSRLMSLKRTVDYSKQYVSMWTYSLIPGAQNLAFGSTDRFMEVRCDQIDYLAVNSGAGCVYWKKIGSLRLQLSDSTVAEAAQFYRGLVLGR